MEFAYGIAAVFVIYIVYTNLKKKSQNVEKPITNFENFHREGNHIVLLM
jgi:hypothetical protein